MKTLCYSILVIVVASCTNPASKHQQKINVDTAAGVTQPHSIEDSVGFSQAGTDSFSYAAADSLFYAVYELSPKTTALVIDFATNDEPKTFLDVVFNHLEKAGAVGASVNSIPAHCDYFDSTGTYHLWRNTAFEKQVKPHFDTTWYIYGTKGVAQTKITQIAFGFDECRTNIFALCIDKSTIQAIGHPLIASRKLFNIKLGDNYRSLDNRLSQMNAGIKSDYADSIKSKIWGNSDSLYFSYHDDFLWGKSKTDHQCFFPDRSVFIVTPNGTIRPYWSDDLDLFGIPCD